VCGAGQADKDQVQRMVAALLGLPRPPEPDHAADALAVAICHVHNMRAGIRLTASDGRAENRPSLP
jgi:crossover junction endodeoxyribonuclease RuvC